MVLLSPDDDSDDGDEHSHTRDTRASSAPPKGTGVASSSSSSGPSSSSSGPSSSSSGPSSASGSASGSAPQSSGALVLAIPRHVYTLLQSATTFEQVKELFPGFIIDQRWHINRNYDNSKLGQIRCISGDSLKCICTMHPLTEAPKNQPCKIHLDIEGKFEPCQVLILLWTIFGSSVTCTKAEHLQVAEEQQNWWRRYVSQ